MGKSVGLIGDLSGKVGNVVFYTRNGVQVARVYVAHPNNPKSSAQNRQRLKMALAGRLTAIVPDGAIEGFGGTKSGRRGRFNSNVLLNSSAIGGKATIEGGSILFADGSLPLLNEHGVSAGESVSNVRSVNIDLRLSGSGDVLPEGYGERFVVLFLNAGTSQFDYAVTGLLEMPESASSDTRTVVSLRVGDRSAVYNAFVYVYPFMAEQEDGGGDFRVSYLGTEDGTVVVDLVTGEELSVPLVFGRSVFVRSILLNPPTMSARGKGKKEE